MERDNWQRITLDNINYTVKDIRDKLFPVLQREQIPEQTRRESVNVWANKLATETRAALSEILPFNKDEIEFLTCLQKHGEIKPELISDDADFCERVKSHPSLLWRINVHS